MAFPFLTLTLIFILVTAYLRYSSTKKHEEKEETFWNREEAAEHVPPVDLSTLTYVTLPASGFHLAGEGEEAELMEAELMELSQKPMLNLSGLTNTDLKMKYGTANFEKMQEIGENFDRLVILLADYGKLLIEQGKIEDAIEVLEFGKEIESDISSNYTFLGDCYEKQGDQKKLEALIKDVDQTTLLLKPKILTSLKENYLRMTGIDLNEPDEGSAPAEPAEEAKKMEDYSSSSDTETDT